MPIINYKDLNVLQKSMDLVVAVYSVVKLLPKYETYGLADQMRRSVVSIPSNIAEGQARNSAADFARFLNIARGSCAELDTQLEICIRLEYVKKSDIENVVELCTIIGKMLSSLISKIR